MEVHEGRRIDRSQWRGIIDIFFFFNKNEPPCFFYFIGVSTNLDSFPFHSSVMITKSSTDDYSLIRTDAITLSRLVQRRRMRCKRVNTRLSTKRVGVEDSAAPIRSLAIPKVRLEHKAYMIIAITTAMRVIAHSTHGKVDHGVCAAVV